jgi:RNA polymerase sigma-70 factor (ECF subfamily)
MGNSGRSLAETRDSPTLVSQMRPALVRFFKRRTGSEAEAEDLAQDVIVRTLNHINWANPAQARGYLFRAAVNRWRDRRRRTLVHGSEVEWNEGTAEESGSANPPERVLIAQEELERVVEVLRGLPPRTRTVVMLIRFEQMRIDAVAERLGISTRAVHRHLAKAMASLWELKCVKDASHE